MKQLKLNLGASVGGSLSGGYELVQGDGFVISWRGVEVVRLRHPWMASQALAILEDMGSPETWRGVFSDDLGRRINRLFLTVPCWCNGAGPCVRPSGHPTTGGEPHKERRQALDDWLK